MSEDRWSRRLAELVSREAGLDLTRCRSADARKVLESAAKQLRLQNEEAVLDAAEKPGAGRLVDTILASLLVHETFFHRYAAQLDVLEKRVLPALFSSSPGRLRLWSAGCSSGPEAYDLAMIALRARDALGLRTTVEVVGTDVSPRAVDLACRGVYPASTVADLPAALARRYLEKEGDAYRVGPELLAAVQFRKHNLRHRPPAGRFHVIACRNVLMYLQDDVAEVAVAHLSSALEPQGVLAVGHGESLRRHASVVAADRDTSVNLYRLAGRPIARKPPPATKTATPLRSKPASAVAPQPRPSRAKHTTAPSSIVLRGVYDARHEPQQVEKLRQALAEAVDAGRSLVIDADPAESLDGATGMMIARAARASEGRIVVKAERPSVRAWARRHGLI